METEEQRQERIIAAMRSVADDRENAVFLPEGNDSSPIARLENAFNSLLRKIREGDRSAHAAANSLAAANVRLMQWNDALQEINHADSLLYHGGDLDTFFHQIVRDAMEMSSARYGALAIFNAEGKLLQFITEGMSEETIGRIGRLPTGKGLLALMYHQTEPLRVNDIPNDPRRCNFPEGHPPMKTLIGVPLLLDGAVKGVLYLADKQSSNSLPGPEESTGIIPFTEDDIMLLGLFSDFMVRALDRLELMSLLRKEKNEQQALIGKLHEAQNQLLQSEKMASIGQLAAGVAHEINNPIGYINSNLGTLKNYVDDLFAMLDAYEQAVPQLAPQTETAQRIESLREKLDMEFLKKDVVALMKESGEGISRVRKIVQDLKDFSHVDEAEWQWADLHKGMESTLNVVWNELKYKTEVVREYGELPNVECLPSQINQVFMNLLVNAAHAIEERGVITIRSGVEGDNAWIEVADTGKGIPPENLQRVFEPFFTTKPVGKGTGLGLSLSYGIVKKHHGRIEVKSEVGKGAVFRIVLPIKQPEQQTL